MIEPTWLKAAFAELSGQSDAEQKRLVLLDNLSIAKRNAKGFVVLSYDVATDMFDRVFGAWRFPPLIDPRSGDRYSDDPLAGRREDIPLAEFLRYLNDWYWPRRRGVTTPEEIAA